MLLDLPALPRTSWVMLLLAWIVSVCATLGSLFFGEVMGMEPCVLCWYQRIAMFPIAVILTIGVYREDFACVRYALPLALAGSLVAAYHFLLYTGFIPEGMQPCGRGVSCSKQDLQIAGVLTIPLMSLMAFTLIAAFLLVATARPRQ